MSRAAGEARLELADFSIHCCGIHSSADGDDGCARLRHPAMWPDGVAITRHITERVEAVVPLTQGPGCAS
jgi:hypothetical protein